MTESPQITMRSIALAVAESHGMTLTELRQQGSRRALAHPRQEFCWRAYQTGKWSRLQIARFVGLTHHTTCLHACRAYEERMRRLDEERERQEAYGRSGGREHRTARDLPAVGQVAGDRPAQSVGNRDVRTLAFQSDALKRGIAA